MKVLFCTSEVVPFAKTGGLADVCGSLPLALEEKDIEVAVTLPLYKCINLNNLETKSVGDDVLETTIGKDVKIFLLENKKFFDRDDLYGNRDGDYSDNLDRFLYYCRRTLDLLKEIDFKVDIIHCHDWQAALIPIFLKTLYKDDPFYKTIKSVLTVHNLAYQGLFPRQQFSKLGLSEDLWSEGGLNFYDKVSLLKGGIIYSDKVTTVSKQYSKEIQGAEFGCGLEKILHKRKESIRGILNGVDYNFWSPENDDLIYKKYSSRNIKDKHVNKQKLQEFAELSIREDVPLFGFVGRFVSQKGLDLLIETMADLMEMDLQMVFLGVGEERYCRFLNGMAQKYPNRVAAFFKFDEKIAHQIYAGSDIFLMPSAHEPCGLSQMISLRYGTIPLVSPRGGLIDTVMSFSCPNGKGNGFVMKKYNKEAFKETVREAVDTYNKKEVFKALAEKAFGYDFSWERSASEYQGLYKECLSSA